MPKRKEVIIFDSTASIEPESDEDVNLWFDDECDNLNKTLDCRLFIVADLGLWNGRHSAYKICSRKLSDIMTEGNYDAIKVYSDGLDIRKDSHHHDGVNHYTFRLIRENRNIEKLCTMLYNGETIDRRTLNYYTKSVLPEIKKIYGI